jgi:hypothetical protein
VVFSGASMLPIYTDLGASRSANGHLQRLYVANPMVSISKKGPEAESAASEPVTERSRYGRAGEGKAPRQR